MANSNVGLPPPVAKQQQTAKQHTEWTVGRGGTAQGASITMNVYLHTKGWLMSLQGYKR